MEKGCLSTGERFKAIKGKLLLSLTGTSWRHLAVHSLCLIWTSRSLVLNLGLLRSFGLQLPEAFTTNCAGKGLWELQSKNILVGNHCLNWIENTAILLLPVGLISETCIGGFNGILPVKSYKYPCFSYYF